MDEDKKAQSESQSQGVAAVLAGGLGMDLFNFYEKGGFGVLAFMSGVVIFLVVWSGILRFVFSGIWKKVT